jgi:dipeptidyl aminopeptidase/acylaminoacyl peptidase
MVPRGFDVYVKAATGLGTEERLVGHDRGDPPSDWSPDGRFILYNRQTGDAGHDIWAVPLDGDRAPFPVVETKFRATNGQFSPDGKWIAFQSNESGQVEVYPTCRGRDAERGFPAMGATNAGGTMVKSCHLTPTTVSWLYASV